MKKTKKVLSFMLVLALVATIFTGATMAYLTSEDEAVNVMALGGVEIEQIEQERNTNGKLVDFTQNKQLLPAVYAGEAPNSSIPWDSAENWAVANDEAWKTVDKTSTNVVDKFVTVKNTGKSDAYVRTIIAYEGDVISGTDIHVCHNSNTSSNAVVSGEFQDTEYIENVTIDGIRYDIIVYTYKDALEADETTIPSLKQVYMDKGCDNEDVAKYGDTYEILVYSQAVQAEGFADAKTALNEAFGKITAENHPWAKAAIDNVGSDKDLEDALKNTEATTIIVNLTEDVTYDVAAWEADAMGGEKTERIVINGNGNTITFNQTDSDWNNIVTNGATLVINNAHITNTGRNDGPWNRHDLNFACDVELNDVTSDKAIALKAGGVLNNVVIDDANASDTYALWIQPKGQTVTLKGCTIDMLDAADGRGIKIDEQYVDAPAKVTLNVYNTTFMTEEKAAILVKSVAGAEINLGNVDISGVAADPVNAVWVDEASAAHADLVVVNGGNKVVEGETTVAAVSTADQLKEAIESGANIISIDGKITLTSGLTADNVTLVGVSDEAGIDFNGNNIVGNGGAITYKNLSLNTISLPDDGTNGERYGWYGGIDYVRHSEANYENCTIQGVFTTYSTTVNVKDCTFVPYLQDGEEFYHIFQYGSAAVNVEGSTFYYGDRAIKIYNEGGTKELAMSISDCTFKADESFMAVNKALINVDDTYLNSVELNIENITVDDALDGVETYSCISADKLTVTVK